MNFNVVAYITAYQDLPSIQKCIKSLKFQSFIPKNLLIIDNSQKALSLDIQIPHIIQYCPENIGVAGGLKLATEWAIENNYDFLWTFDQDSQPDPNTLKILLSEYEYLNQKNIPVGIISPTIIDYQTQKKLPNGLLKKYKLEWILPEISPPFFHYYREKLYQCDVVITSGSLINLQAAKNIALPNPDLFIDGVDWEYCLNMRKHGYHICVSEKTTMQHNFGTYLTHLNKSHPIYIYSPLRYYYINRNHTYIETRLSNNPYYKTLSYLHRIKSLIKKIGKIIIYEPGQKLIKIWASCLGFYHGLIGKLGKTWLL
ncbi:glycosyltransferase family 2 protein [Synechocystis sp. FACHB-383]|uniref:glycosyltransferase family 2 protein n=1 Tax=Synechocystis sp. FACHB-383 TaxID=2692864 RepID=UPI001688B553|nr:glycosyltransferase family 2 protein [Synechocystis sp. FACHB-383]MBD2655382.1 glycosyltransferase family 2 protein [Synechocystis sp. FACHB-383]